MSEITIDYCIILAVVFGATEAWRRIFTIHHQDIPFGALFFGFISGPALIISKVQYVDAEIISGGLLLGCTAAISTIVLNTTIHTNQRGRRRRGIIRKCVEHWRTKRQSDAISKEEGTG